MQGERPPWRRGVDLSRWQLSDWSEPESGKAGGEHEVDNEVQEGEDELEVAEHEGE
jgi:hypothetical protein